MLLVGALLGPHIMNVLDPGLVAISSELRMLALIVILLRAGFELSKDTLQRVGRYALLLAFIPAVFEGTTITLIAPSLLDLTYLEAAILGAVLSAVSPAVVVRLMVEFIEKRKGTAKGIPTLIIAASSIDDVFVIVIYSVLMGIYTGQEVNLGWKLLSIPVSILTGIAVGLVVGWLLLRLFQRYNPRATKRVLLVLAISILLVRLEVLVEPFWPFAALLAVMSIGFLILTRRQYAAHEISVRLSKLWILAEIVLFVMVGAQVDISWLFRAGLMGCVLLAIGLMARSLGTYLCLMGSNLTQPERLFVVISYIPKATVQAAIGGAPLIAMSQLAMNTAPGEIILAIAVLSIVTTAPLGAWMIEIVGNRVLQPGPVSYSESRDAVLASNSENLVRGSLDNH